MSVTKVTLIFFMRAIRHAGHARGLLSGIQCTDQQPLITEILDSRLRGNDYPPALSANVQVASIFPQ
jgi:hypothetical protein